MTAYAKRLKAYTFGNVAEIAVICYLTLKCYRIVAHRYRTRAGEIDIVACRGNTLAFIEVKARKRFDNTEEILSYRQQQRIVRAASLFIARKPHFLQHSVRFDLVLITPRPWIRHIENAWQ